MGPPALLPIRRKVCWGFLSPLKIHRLGRFEPATLESSVMHTNHYTTEATTWFVLRNLRTNQRLRALKWTRVSTPIYSRLIFWKFSYSNIWKSKKECYFPRSANFKFCLLNSVSHCAAQLIRQPFWFEIHRHTDRTSTGEQLMQVMFTWSNFASESSDMKQAVITSIWLTLSPLIVCNAALTNLCSCSCVRSAGI
jgi:hypothetical protein